MYFSSAQCMLYVCDSSSITTKNSGTIPSYRGQLLALTYSVIQAVDTDLKSGDVTSDLGYL